MAKSQIATAYVQVMPSMDGVAKKVENYYGEAGASAGKTFGAKMGGVLKAGAAAGVAGLGLVLKEGLEEGAGLQQSLGGIETLFKDNAEDVITAANEAYRTAGMSANKYMETVTGFSASLIKSLEGDTQKAAAVADMALVDMSDNANKMGSDMQSIQDAYQGFAKQNYTMLDNLKLGYGGTKTEMERLLRDAEAINAAQGIMTEYSIDNLADVYEAIHVVQEEMGIMGATADEAEKTMTGSFNAMKASFQNVLGNLALDRPMENSLKALAETTGVFLKDNLIPSAINILEGLPEAFNTLWETLELPGFNDLPNLANSAGQLLRDLGTNLWENKDEMLGKLRDLGFEAGTTLWTSLKAMWAGLSGEGLSVGISIQGAAAGAAQGGLIPHKQMHGGLSGSFAKGLDYVPYDGFIAELHEGEMILTKAQANTVRKGSVGGGVTVNQYFYDHYKTAADQMAAARYEQEKAVLGLV